MNIFNAGDNYPILMGTLNNGEVINRTVDLIDGQELQDLELKPVGSFSDLPIHYQEEILANTDDNDADFIKNGKVFYKEEEDNVSWIVLYGSVKTNIDKEVDGFENAVISEDEESYFVDLGTGLGEAEYPKCNWSLDQAIQDQTSWRVE